MTRAFLFVILACCLCSSLGSDDVDDRATAAVCATKVCPSGHVCKAKNIVCIAAPCISPIAVCRPDISTTN